MDAPAGNKFMFANDGKRLDAFYPKSVTAILGKEAFVYKPNEVHRSSASHVLNVFLHKPVCCKCFTTQK
jgi:hypothetical protein